MAMLRLPCLEGCFISVGLHAQRYFDSFNVNIYKPMPCTKLHAKEKSIMMRF